MSITAGQLTQLHRRQQLTLREATLAELRRLWPVLKWDDLDGTYPALAGRATETVAKGGRRSVALSAAYLRAHRVASGLNGDVRIVLPPVVNVKQLDASLHALSVASVKVAASKSVPEIEAMSNALTRSSGAMATLVLNAGRQSILQTLRGDDRAIGWHRIVGNGACAWCTYIGGSGSRIYPNDNADFEAHPKCGCTSEPVYD